MKILVINAGSSSVKYQLFDMTDETVMAKGMADCIGMTLEGLANVGKPNFKHTPAGRPSFTATIPFKNHADAIKLIVSKLVDPELGVIGSMSEINAVGHRVLHGGEYYSESVIIDGTDGKVMEALHKCIPLGPLHEPHNITGIKACAEIMGENIPQVAVFDTAFHQTMPDYAYMYALPEKYYKDYHIRRYGFHGTSHRYITMKVAELLGKKSEELNIVTCHLGNGSSITAVKNGKCFDTTMGLTPLEGIIMGTRCGSIDPAIVPFIMKQENLTPDEMDNLMNKKSGILGVTGITSDNRWIEQHAKEGDPKAVLVENMICHQLTKYIGGYAAAMGGVDVIAFAGGIGENNPQYRTRVAENLAFMGVRIDEEKNLKAVHGGEGDISAEGSSIKMMIIATDEELMIARDTLKLVSEAK
ncbi:MAG: acetate kinase [Clostridia bacterium]|nr:acetate kinase [Clostridia bacterium]